MEHSRAASFLSTGRIAGRLRCHSLIEGGQRDIASAPLVGQEAAWVEVPNAMKAGALVCS